MQYTKLRYVHVHYNNNTGILIPTSILISFKTMIYTVHINWEYLPEDSVCASDDWREREREHKKK